jgi:hypothetical protein
MSGVLAALLPVLELLLRALVPVLVEKLDAPKTVEEARPADARLREYLRDRVRAAEDGPGSTR